MKRLSWFVLVMALVMVISAMPVAAGGPAPVATEAVVSLPPCDVEGGVQLQPTARNDGKWMINREISGCNLLFEGRLDQAQVHHIYILRSTEGEGPYFDSEGNFIFMEGSVWAYPTGWNMDDFSASKPPIAAEFVNTKAENMKANGYSWPIVVHNMAGNELQFEAGVMLPDVVLPNNCSFDQPQPIKVSGIYDAKTGAFNASIGAADCWTVVWVNGTTKAAWFGAKDNVPFKTILAWLMPTTWSNDQIDKWQPPTS